MGRPQGTRHHRQQIHHPVRGAGDRRQEAVAPRPEHGLRQAPARPGQGHRRQRQRVGPGQRQDSARRDARHPVRPRPAARLQGSGRGQALGGLRAARRGRQGHPEGDLHLRRARGEEDRGQERPAGRSADVRRGAGTGSDPLHRGRRRQGLPRPEGRTAPAHPGRPGLRTPAGLGRLAGHAPHRGPDHLPDRGRHPGGPRGRPRHARRPDEPGRHGPDRPSGNRDPELRRPAGQGRPRLGLHRQAPAQQQASWYRSSRRATPRG